MELQAPSTTSLDYQMRGNFHHGTVIRPPMDPSVYSAPPATPYYTYAAGSGPSPVHHADYQAYYVGPDRSQIIFCSCGDRNCARFSVPDMYNVGGRPPPSSTAQYYGHHVALPPGPPAVYPGHQMVYPGEHYQIIGPPPEAHYLHHRHHYPPPSTGAPHFEPVYHHGNGLGAAPPRHMTAAAAGESVTVTMTTSCPPIISGDSVTAQTHNIHTASSASDNTDHREPLHSTATTLIPAEHDIAPIRVTSSISSTQLHAYSSGNLFSCLSAAVNRLWRLIA